MSVITINPREPARIGWRLPRGAKWREQFFFLDQAGARADMTGVNPQLMLRPRSKGSAYGYDIDMGGYEAGGYGVLDVDGAAINDPYGYLAEMYSRDSSGTPTGLLAQGRIAISGGSYAYEGPFAPLTLPVVAGPPGPGGAPGKDSTVPGPAGQRGSMWFTGAGAPATAGQVEGDMWLDESNGDVYRWSGTVWSRGTF